MGAMLLPGDPEKNIAPMGRSYRSCEWLPTNKNAGACAPAFS